MAIQDSRTGQLNAVINPKLLFLAKLAARYKHQTLVEFIEDAFRRALTESAMREHDEDPSLGHGVQITRDISLWGSKLWSDDEAERLYLVGMENLNLLAPRQRELFFHVQHELSKQGKKFTSKNFVEFFDKRDEDKK